MKQQLICEVYYEQYGVYEWCETVYLFDGWVVEPGYNINYVSGNPIAIFKPQIQNIRNIRYDKL